MASQGGLIIATRGARVHAHMESDTWAHNDIGLIIYVKLVHSRLELLSVKCINEEVAFGGETPLSTLGFRHLELENENAFQCWRL